MGRGEHLPGEMREHLGWGLGAPRRDGRVKPEIWSTSMNSHNQKVLKKYFGFHFLCFKFGKGIRILLNRIRHTGISMKLVPLIVPGRQPGGAGGDDEAAHG